MRPHSMLVLWFALTAATCETVVDVKLPPQNDLIVAHGLFSPDSLWRVNVSTSISSTDSEAPGLVDDALVEVWGAERIIERLRPIGQGTYRSTTRRPKPGESYTLRITSPAGYRSEGVGLIPPAPRVLSFVQQDIEQLGESDIGLKTVRLHLTVDDPAGIPNRYGLRVLQDRRIVNRATGEVTNLPRANFVFATNDPVLADSDILDPEKTILSETVFGDDLFDGRTRTFDFEIQYSLDRRDSDVRIERAFTVAFSALSEDYYRYWKTATLQTQVGDNPFSEPVRIHSNMTAGLGIFAGFHTASFPLEAAD